MGTIVSPTYLGDFSYGQTVYLAWNSLNSSGASVAPTGTPTVRVYKNGGTTEDTSTGTSTFSFDSKTGINYVTVTLTSSSFFTPGSDFFIALDSMTLDGQTVSAVVAHFSIENRTSIAPMIRGLVASATSSTATLDTAAAATNFLYQGCLLRIVSGTGVGQSRIIYGYTSGRVASVVPNWQITPDSTSYYQILPVGSDNVVTINCASSITAATTVNANVTQIDGSATSGNNATLNLKQLNIVNNAGTAVIAQSTGSNGDGITATANGSGKDIRATNNTITGNLSGSVGSVTGNVGGNVSGNVTGSVGSVSGAVGSVTSGVTVTTNNDKTGYRLSATGVDDIWDEVQSGHSTSGTFGKYLDAAVSGVSTGGVSVADIADAVWDEARSGHTSSGSFGQGVASVVGAVGSVTGDVGGNVTGSVGSVSSSVTVGTNNDKTGYRLSATGVDDVWDEARSGHTTSGTFGEGTSAVLGAVGSVTGNVGGNVTGSVGSLTSGALSSIATKIWDESISSHTIAGSTGSVLQPTYFADVSFVRNQSIDQDEYTITWFKNGLPIMSGITSPTIQVIKRNDGSDIVSLVSVSEIAASTGIYKYDSTSSNRVVVGDAAIVIVKATIDSATRTFRKVIGRDS